ncbi:MAG: ABC transporter ATP-binding protein/permease [Alicyclobacillus sp.]|nr:ABC transporter ATP-binding protein/permease [Alicyclobacillus sp.]
MDDPRRLLLAFIRSKKWAYLASTASIVLSEAVTVQFPRLLGQFTDALSAHRLTPGLVGRYAALLLAVGVGYVALFGVGQFWNGRLGRQFEYELRRRLFLHWETLSTGYFRTRSIGDLLNHAMNDVQNVREVLAGGLNILTNAVFLMIAALIMTFRTVSVKLTLVSLLPMLSIPLFIVWLGPRLRAASRRVQEGLSDMADLTEESLSAIRLVKATANEAVEGRRFRARVDEVVRRQMSLVHRSALFQTVFPFVESLSFAIALVYGGTLTAEGRMPLGSFVAFTLYLGMLMTPMQQIGFVINNFQRASASLARLSVLLGEEPDIRDPARPLPVDRLSGDIRVDLPEFRYPDARQPALRDIRFHVREGETVGIVGRTGSGKTTLVNLLPRIFDPPPGTVYVGGCDVRSVRLRVLREAIAYVPQDGFLFSATIGENIGFSKEDAAPDEIEQAARDACIEEDIRRFKEGFDTLIGERGVTLSGGQKQRTAIARAFLKDAPILVLDDALSAVDMNTEKQIIARIRALRHGRTTLIIAHRLSAVRHADHILVMDRGRLVEQGTHDELVALGGIYAEMYRLQEADSPDADGTAAPAGRRGLP